MMYGIYLKQTYFGRGSLKYNLIRFAIITIQESCQFRIFVTKGVALLGTMLCLSNPLRIEIFVIRKRIVLQYILERSDSCILGLKYVV